MALDYDPFSETAQADPYPAYRALREAGGVHRAPGSGIYVVSRHDDCMFVLKQPELFSSRAMIDVLRPGFSWEMVRFLVRAVARTGWTFIPFPRPRTLIAEDPPVHAELRGTISRGFTPRRIARLEPRAREIVAELLSKLARDEPFDVIRDLASPLPATIMAEMLGVEPGRHGDFKCWSDAILAGATGSGRGRPMSRAFADTLIELGAYLRDKIVERRRQPSDDLISAMVVRAPGDRPLTNTEIALFLQLMIVAGNETTTNLIGNAVHALLEHPDQLEQVRKDPSLVPGLIEETLRYDSPAQLVLRSTTRSVDLLGTRIPRRATVAVLLGSANRDERIFEAPDRFDVRRDARGHIAFGGGAHFCLGAALARLEATAALEALVPELPRLERARPTHERVDSFLARGLRSLELRRSRVTTPPGSDARAR